jgi:DNA-binding NarL/FixJ family response regulator
VVVPAIAVLADDLIWATRLTEAVRRAGATPARVGSAADLAALLDPRVGSAPDAGADRPRLRGAIVDLFARRYAGADAIAQLAAAGIPVIAVAEHDDTETRKAALAAGALRVFSYNLFFREGTALVERWLAGEGGNG